MAYPDCIHEIVGLRYCGAFTPSSELYLNDVEGISLEMLADLANEEMKTFAGVFDAVRTRIELKLPGEVMHEIGKCYQVKSLQCIKDIICEFSEDLSHAILYRYAVELMIELLHGSSWNRWVQTREEAQAALEHYQAEYLSALNIWVKGLAIEPCERSECFKCGGSGLHRGVQLP